MTKRFVQENSISLDVLKSMQPGSQLGPIPEGFMVNPNTRRGAPRSGYPEANLVIKRFGVNELRDRRTSDTYAPYGKYGIIDNLGSGGSQGPKAGGQTPEEVMNELLKNEHSVRGEIRNKGE